MRDTYSQFEVVGLHNNGIQYDTDISNAKLLMNIESDQPFDLFILESTLDFECYIKAVKMLK
jgi:hypothetical protein